MEMPEMKSTIIEKKNACDGLGFSVNSIQSRNKLINMKRFQMKLSKSKQKEWKNRRKEENKQTKQKNRASESWGGAFKIKWYNICIIRMPEAVRKRQKK